MRSREYKLAFLVGVAALGLAALIGMAPMAVAYDRSQSNPIDATSRLAEAVRHELVMLPFYGVFDNFEFQLLGNGTVVLSGEVTRPTLKSDAENVVRRISGVNKVENNIEVLPLSPYDNRVRLAVYRALFSNPMLDRYSMGAIPSIHIIVKNGTVTLVGVVSRQSEKDVAGIVANSVSGIFRVTNELRVENAGKMPPASPGANPPTVI